MWMHQIWGTFLCTRSVSQGLADNAVISRVNGELWDLDRPLEQDCSLEILRFDNEDAQAVSKISFLIHDVQSYHVSLLTSAYRVLGVLALQCSHPGGGDGALLWRLFVLRTPDWEWFLLRHVPGWTEVSSFQFSGMILVLKSIHFSCNHGTTAF